jgi:hypothetical protein
MAIGVYYAPAALTAEKYDECIKRLKKAGAGHPAGRTYHASFGPSDKLMVFDVWTSQASLDKFGKTLAPILTELGVDPGQPNIMPMHKVITRPAASAGAKKVPSARRARRRVGKKR